MCQGPGLRLVPGRLPEPRTPQQRASLGGVLGFIGGWSTWTSGFSGAQGAGSLDTWFRWGCWAGSPDAWGLGGLGVRMPGFSGR